MLVVVNGNFGGFRIPCELEEALDVEFIYDDSMEIRTNQLLIDWVLQHIEETDLTVVRVPSDYTDLKIFDYDGVESIWYVQNGKIKIAERVV